MFIVLVSCWYGFCGLWNPNLCFVRVNCVARVCCTEVARFVWEFADAKLSLRARACQVVVM